jgi:hypothetical protein
MPNQFTVGYPDFNSLNPIPRTEHRNANVRSIIVPFVLLTTTVVGELVFVAKIKSEAIILPSAQFIHGAAGGTTTIDLGFANETPAGAINCLAAAQSIVAAGTKNALASVTTPNLGRPCWQLAGLASNPAREMDLSFRVQTAAATAPTNIFAMIHFALPA